MRHAGCTIPCDAEAQLGMHVLCRQTAMAVAMACMQMYVVVDLMPACEEGCRV
jgi:hypothetical protein